MLADSKVVITSYQSPICPNCWSEMCLAEPDEFFETYAYYCDECGIRTKECGSPDEAYATIRKQPLDNGGRMAELDV